MKLTDIASKIDAHLKRFEADAEINRLGANGLRPYCFAHAGRSGRWIYVQYVSYQGSINLDRATAEKYLAWLDSDNIGTHWRIPKVSQ